MLQQPEENDYYTTVYLPLTAEDKLVIERAEKPHYQVFWILFPLLIIAFFFGLLYFIPYLVLLILYIVFTFSTLKKYKNSLLYPKVVLTGKITKKEPPGDGTFIYFGKERFELSYAKVNCPIEIDDVVSLHFSQFNNQQRGILLSVEHGNQP